MNILHIHGQISEHCDAIIVGNAHALEELAGLIKAVLQKRGKCLADAINVMASDGEGYTVAVCLLDVPWDGKAWRDAAYPYTDDKDDRQDAVWPHEYKPVQAALKRAERRLK